jgi:ribosomal-protein-serine acetyltransferase
MNDRIDPYESIMIPCIGTTKNSEERTTMGPPRFIIDQDTELHLLTEHDAAAVFSLIEQHRLYLREWLPWVDYTRSVEDERTFIRMLYGQYLENNGFACAIWYQGQITGTISYHPINWTQRKVEIGYWLAAPYQGKGLMTKSCRAMITYAFDTLKLHKVEIRCAIGNTRSCAIPQRLGFRPEGIVTQGEWLYDHFVDLFLYGMLASEWNRHSAIHF